MKPKTKKIAIFIILVFFILIIAQVLMNSILPVKSCIASISVGRLNSGDVLFYSESESYTTNDYIIYRPSSKQVNYIAEIIEINPDGTFKVISGTSSDPIVQAEQNNLKQEQILGKVIYSISMYILYPIVIIISIILAFVLTHFISKKIKTE
jgi:hypothetical protein